MTASTGTPGGRARLSIARKLLFSALLLCAAVLAAELAVRALRPQEIAPILNDPDPVYGERTRRNVRATHRGREFTYTIRTDGRGFRGRGLPLRHSPSTFRILCLGDSFTFGVGVEEKEAWPAVLERVLNAGAAEGPGLRYEALNAGNCGWGTAQELAFLEEEGLAYAPDLVVLCICGNDLEDSIASGLFTLEGGALVRHPPRVSEKARLKRFLSRIPLYETVAARSQLLALARRGVLARLAARGATPAAGEEGAGAPQDDLALMAAMVLRIRELAGGKLIVVMVSDPQTPALGAPGAVFMNPLRDRLLREGLAVLDTNLLFWGQRLDPGTLHFRNDGHWTPLGHELTARALAPLAQSARRGG